MEPVPEHLLFFTTPAKSGERKIYSLVRVSAHLFMESWWISSEPVALIIEENGVWHFSPLEDGISDDILLRAEPV
ncbi:MAG TPA: hypothetical protein VN429_08995 [Methanospirillum sp.]|nr:hypothetical protein [Methanospirillum sp.]